jgi:hypothetical protein
MEVEGDFIDWICLALVISITISPLIYGIFLIFNQ